MYLRPESTFISGEASLQCSIEDGRLVAPQTCNETLGLMSEIAQKYMMEDQLYFIGVFAMAGAGHGIYRNWRNDKVFYS